MVNGQPSNLIAITRAVSPSLVNCELTHLERQAIDIDLARTQHHRYEACLAELGCQVQQLPAEPELPDSVFVEDIAVVLDELAVIMHPGAESRRPEVGSIAQALAPYRHLEYIQPPGTLDGGDVLRIAKNLYVGHSSRSNAEGIEQLCALLDPFGYRVQAIAVQGCLHLKSAVTQVALDTLLINPDWVDWEIFGDMNQIEVDPQESLAANALLLSATLVYPAVFPRTLQRLQAADIDVRVVDVSELGKAEGGVTCCSLIFKI
jgi:dimethylargininase